MLDKLLRIGSTFSPIRAMLDDELHGPGIGFRVPANSGWTDRQLEGFLAQHNIHTWGWRVYRDMIIFDVNKAQGEQARKALEQCGVNYQGG